MPNLEGFLLPVPRGTVVAVRPALLSSVSEDGQVDEGRWFGKVKTNSGADHCAVAGAVEQARGDGVHAGCIGQPQWVALIVGLRVAEDAIHRQLNAHNR